jgi:hypothetical protein
MAQLQGPFIFSLPLKESPERAGYYNPGQNLGIQEKYRLY